MSDDEQTRSWRVARGAVVVLAVAWAARIAFWVTQLVLISLVHEQQQRIAVFTGASLRYLSFCFITHRKRPLPPLPIIWADCFLVYMELKTQERKIGRRVAHLSKYFFFLLNA